MTAGDHPECKEVHTIVVYPTFRLVSGLCFRCCKQEIRLLLVFSAPCMLNPSFFAKVSSHEGGLLQFCGASNHIAQINLTWDRGGPNIKMKYS